MIGVNAYASAPVADAKQLTPWPSGGQLDIALITPAAAIARRARRARSPGDDRAFFESRMHGGAPRTSCRCAHRLARSAFRRSATCRARSLRTCPRCCSCASERRARQMAAALLDHSPDGRRHVRSAGRARRGDQPGVIDGDGRDRPRPLPGVPQAAHRRVRPGRRRRDHDGLRRRLPDLSRASATRTGSSTTRRTPTRWRPPHPRRDRPARRDALADVSRLAPALA